MVVLRNGRGNLADLGTQAGGYDDAGAVPHRDNGALERQAKTVAERRGRILDRVGIFAYWD